MKHKLPQNFRYLALAMVVMTMGLTKAQPFYQSQPDPSSAQQSEPAGTDSCGNPNDGGTPPPCGGCENPCPGEEFSSDADGGGEGGGAPGGGSGMPGSGGAIPKGGGASEGSSGAVPRSALSSGISNSAGRGISLNMDTANFTHGIKDFEMKSAIGYRGLAFTRTATTRYSVGAPTELGGGGSWKHNWQYTVFRGAPNAVGEETVIVIFPNGIRGEYAKASSTATFMTEYRPSSHERMERNPSNANVYWLWFADGSRLVITRTGTVGGADEKFNVTSIQDPYGLGYTLLYDTQNRLTRVTDPGLSYLQFTYANVGPEFDSTDVTFSFTVPNGVSATSVSLAGNFNNWSTSASPMIQQNGGSTWTITRPIQKGTWQYKFVVNNNDWYNDPSAPTDPGSGNSLVDVATANVEGTNSQPQNVVFEVAGTATSMTLVGSFNGWNTTSLPMTWNAASGKWTRTVSLSPGPHAYKFFKNGGTWLADPTNPFTDNNGNSTLNVGLMSEKLVRVEGVRPTGAVVQRASFAYEVFSVNSSIVFATLKEVSYLNDTAKSLYSYSGGLAAMGRPRLTLAQDPRHSNPMLRNIAIEYRNNTSFEGLFKKLKHPTTGLVHAELKFPGTNARAVIYPNGDYAYIHAPVNVTGAPQGLGNFRANGSGGVEVSNRFANGYGMVSSITDAASRTTSYQRTAEFGRITRTDLPDGKFYENTYTNATKPFHLASVRDADGLVTSYTRDALNRVTTVTHPDATTETFTYNSLNRILTYKNRQNVTEFYTYNANGQLTARRLGSSTALTGLTEYTYHTDGKLATVTTPAIATGPSTTARLTKFYTYDAAGRIIRIDYQNSGSTIAFETNTWTNGNLTAHRNSRGFTTTYTYDAYGRRLTEKDPLNRITTYEYGIQGGCSSCGASGQPNRITAPDGIVTENTYNLDNSLETTTIAPGTPAQQTTSYTYDILGRRSTVTSPLGLVTTYNYDPLSGDLISTVIGAPFNYTTSYSYNAAGLQTIVTHPDGTKAETTYDALGRRTGSITREANNTIVQQNSLTYNALGQVATSKDGNNNTTTYSYNALGLLATTTLPNGRTQSITAFDNALNPVNITSPTGQFTTVYRDIFGRTITTIQDTVTHTRVYESAPGGLLLGSVGGGKTTTYTYDSLGRTTSTTTANVATTFAWNDVTRTSSTSTAGRINTQTRDLAGRVIATKDGLNRTTTISYTINAANKTLTTVSTNPAGQATTAVSNGLGQTISSTNANNETTNYNYDALGRQISYTDPKGATFSFLYNAAGQRTRRTEPDATYQTYSYDLAGNMTQHRKADGSIATITYTNLNQPDLKTWGGSSEYNDWTYNNLGRLTSVDNQTTTTLFTYNNSSGSSGIAGTLVHETTIHKNFANLTRRVFHTYDSFKRLSAISVGDSSSSSYGSLHTLSYGYYPSTGYYNYQNQNEGLLQSINNEGPPPLATYSYNGGLLNNISLENNTYATITRDAAYQITTYSHPGAGGNTGTTAQYGYDNAGHRTWVKYEDNLGQAYAYDNAGKVTHAKVGIANANTAIATSSPTHFYDYDLAGNREQMIDGGVTTNYTPNAVNAYTAISGFANPSYDPNGNMLTGPISSALASLSYDQENRLTSSNLGGSTNSYTYDALGRISTLTYSLNGVSTTEIYTWTGWTLLYRELMQNGVAIEKFRYTWGLDVSGTLEGAGGVGGLLAIERGVSNSSTWDIRYPHYDANGNIMALSNSSGQISARYRYDAFGKTILSTDVDGTGWNTKNIHGFSTKPKLGNHHLHYYGYRWYDASNGRWLNRDPIEESGGLNLYGFVGNNGVGNFDILGLDSKEACEAALKKAASDERVESIRIAMSKLTPKCPDPHVSCKCCDKEKYNAAYYRDSNRIVFCANKFPVQFKLYGMSNSYADVLYHEYIHAYQKCTFNQGAMTNCRFSLCKEIQAYYNANCKNAPDPKACTIYGAKQSAKQNCDGGTDLDVLAEAIYKECAK